MEKVVHNVLQALSLIEVRGEKNHELVLYCIQQLKALQLASADAAKTRAMEVK